MDENYTSELRSQQTSQKLGLREQFTKVTPVSRFLATALLVTLPFLGFWFGVQFEKENAPAVIKETEIPAVAKTQVSDSALRVPAGEEINIATTTNTSELLTYRNEKHGIGIKYPRSLTAMGTSSDGESETVVDLGICPTAADKCQEAFSISVQNIGSLDLWYDLATKGGYYNSTHSAPNFEDVTIGGLPARKILDKRDSFSRGGATCQVTAIYSRGRVFEICDNLSNEVTKSIIGSLVID